MAAFKDYTTICPVGPSELLSLIALRAKEKIIERHLKRIEKNLGLLDNFFQRHKQFFSWVRPKAGTIGFSKILFNENSLKFCERVVNEAGIMVLPSTVYGYDDKHFRVGFGRGNIPEALAEFEKYLKSNPPKKFRSPRGFLPRPLRRADKIQKQNQSRFCQILFPRK